VRPFGAEAAIGLTAIVLLSLGASAARGKGRSGGFALKDYARRTSEYDVCAHAWLPGPVTVW
jgi:hypothetical protein